MVNRNEIVTFLDELLKIDAVSDHSMNGLQVQGAKHVAKIGLATDAALATYKKAVEQNCQMLLTHHGFIWGGLNYITGRNYDHLSFLIKNNLNLYGAHLPLDIHPEFGNNAILAHESNLQDIEPFGNYHGTMLGFAGKIETPMSLNTFADKWQSIVGTTPKVLNFGKDKISTVAIISGGGSSCLTEAIDKKIDVLVTGEGPHERYHQALEGNINVIYIGHYASETCGVIAIGKELEMQFDVETVFIDMPTGF